MLFRDAFDRSEHKQKLPNLELPAEVQHIGLHHLGSSNHETPVHVTTYRVPKVSSAQPHFNCLFVYSACFESAHKAFAYLKQDLFCDLVGCVQIEGPVQVARRSDVDMNGHINNVTYLAWALETVPSEIYYHYELMQVSHCMCCFTCVLHVPNVVYI